MNESIMKALCLFAEDKHSEIRNFRICAGVIHKHKEIVALGFPRRKTHPLQKQCNPDNEHAIYLHAEIDAIIRALRQTKLHPKHHSIYVARVKQQGPFDFSFIKGLAKPCTACTLFIHNCGLNQIHYTIG